MTALFLDRDTTSMRRGACPALSDPMETGDGLLARIALTEAIAPRQLAEICRLALQHGNGMLDISARGNLQVRGLSETSAPRLDAAVRALDLPLRQDLAVETPPLAGLDAAEIADPRPLAEAIRQGARGIAGLAPKISVVVDGGGQLRLSDLIADIRLVAVRSGEWKILLGNTERSGNVFNVLRETLVVETVLSLLRALSDLGPTARGRDLAAGLPDLPSRSPGLAAEAGTTSPFDRFAVSDGLQAVGIGPAFGQARAEDMTALCDAARRRGIKSVKPAFDHCLLFFGAPSACRSLQHFADENGFVTAASDPRSHIAACPGSPACKSATIATRKIASQAARECGDLLDGSFKLHITGCRKGCAHPQPAALTLCGSTTDVSLLAGAKASGQPFASASFADTNAALRRLADLVSLERRAGETSAACLARIGADRLAAATTGPK